jgi:nitroimidazol reductase NimA-like FMN-containing flavoprotein (pyridoxamine 5'-phosphate oxidase superfamily)
MAEPTPLRRGDKAITEVAELYQIIDEASVLRLAMVDEGRPYVVPLNFAREGDTLWMHCATAGRKLECLRREPAVCVEVDRFVEIVEGSGSDPCTWTARYESVIGFGMAEIIEVEEDRIHGLLAIMGKYSGRGDWTFPREMLGKIEVLCVHLESFTGKHSPL